MANMHLVTGYAGQEHVTAADQGIFNAAIFGKFQAVLGKGNKLSASVLTNNSVRVLDGDIFMKGRHVRLNEGTYVDLTIENGQQGYKRNDLIVARYTKDIQTAVEEVNLAVIKGTAIDGEPSDPEYTEGNIYDGGATLHEMPLYRVPLDGLNVGELVCLFNTFEDNFYDHTNNNDRHVTKEDQIKWNGMIPKSQKGQPNGVATLGEDGILEESQRPIINAYTKPETLSPETKTLLGLGADAVPDDAFAILGGAASDVGDIKMSIRTDLDDSWVLCNGEPINEDEYPILYNLAESLRLGYTKTLVSDGSYNCKVHCLKYINGYWVAGLSEQTSSSGSVAYVAYATDLYGSWSTKRVWSSNHTSVAGVYDVTYGGGYWVAVGKGEGSSKQYGELAYNPDITNDGGWVQPSIFGYDNYCSLDAVIYADGYWVLGGRDDDDGLIFFSTDITETSWRGTRIFTDYYDHIYDIVYAAGYWVVGGEYGGNNKNYAEIAYAADITVAANEWTKVAVWGDGTNTYNRIFSVVYANGYWVVAGQGKDTSSSPISARIAYATDLAGPWTIKDLWQGGSSSTTTIQAEQVIYANNKWYVCGNNYVAFADSLDGEWIVFDCWPASPYSGGTACCIASDGVDIVVGGVATTTKTEVNAKNAAQVSLFGRCLPQITADNAYVYIKGK